MYLVTQTQCFLRAKQDENMICLLYITVTYTMSMNKEMLKQRKENVTNIASEPSRLYNDKLISMSISL